MKKTHRLILFLLVMLSLCLSPATLLAQDSLESSTEATVETEQAFLSLTLGEALAIAVGTFGLFVAFGKILWDANQNPSGASLDTRLTERVSAVSSDRAYMDGLEKGYQAANAAMHKALESTVKVLEIIAPQTGLKVDDALLNVLKDIQTPGAVLQVNDPAAGVVLAQSVSGAMRGDVDEGGAAG